jgi:Tol biopolymer transport system component
MRYSLYLLFFCFVTWHLPTYSQPLWVRYPSISPDGKWIAFSYQGDIHVVATSGGEARAVTRHPSHDFQPVWSNDSRVLAFASDRYGNFDVFTVPLEGGEPKRLTVHSAAEYPEDFTTDGKQILYTAAIQDHVQNADFPTSSQSELYAVSIAGGQSTQVLTTPALQPRAMPGSTQLVYEDSRGYENNWRKHQVSAFAKDLWLYNSSDRTHRRLTAFQGDDRNPVPSQDGKSIFYLSEMQGSFNVYRLSLTQPANPEALTSFQSHPVRFLSISDNGLLCFFYDGDLYTLQPGVSPQKVPLVIRNDSRAIAGKFVTFQEGITAFDLSPNGKEIAFIYRGELFVTAVNGSITKRITNTPEQERSVSFSPDGKKLLYASERGGSWNIYQTSLVRPSETYFHTATLLREDTLVATAAEEFQPDYSPDGKEIAYLEERTALKVYTIATKATRTILPEKRNYSYADGDQYFQWSPDSKWLLVSFLPDNHWIGELGMVRADGKSAIVNLSQSGYSDWAGDWVLDGAAILWYSDRHGMKNHASWGAQSDLYMVFLKKEAFERFNLSKEDFELLKEQEKKDSTAEKGATKAAKDSKKSDSNKIKEPEPIQVDWDGIAYRKVRLTRHSANLSASVLSPDGERLYYMANFEKGYDLWVLKTREKDAKLLTKLGTNPEGLTLDKEGKYLYVLANGTLLKIETESGKSEPISVKGEMLLDERAERSHLFEHVWRQAKKKFYRTDLHGVDWDFYKKSYARFLPTIDNNHDFAEMLSEMLGELNASHTGAGYRSNAARNDATASLGALYDYDFKGRGVRLAEILQGSPLDVSTSRCRAGTIVERIDGQEVQHLDDLYALLNRKDGVRTLVSCYDELKKERWEETIKPISYGEQSKLLYRRWIKRNNEMVERLSGGTLGYVHVENMTDESFRDFYEKALGLHANKKGLLVDTRYNGGGWLHDDLATFLHGKQYADMVPREQKIGFDPQRKWTKPSVVLVNEGNYSDAHFFPFVYKALGIGKLVGSPVPGTATAVWWETLQDRSLYFGIPQVGIIDKQGNYLENNQLTPDVVVYQTPESLAQGKDLQLEKAVEVLLKEVGR